MACYGYTVVIHSSYFILSLKPLNINALSHKLTVAAVTLFSGTARVAAHERGCVLVRRNVSYVKNQRMFVSIKLKVFQYMSEIYHAICYSQKIIRLSYIDFNDKIRAYHGVW